MRKNNHKSLPEDIDDQALQEIIAAYKNFKTLSRFGKYLIAAIFLVIVEGNRFLSALADLWDWLKHLLIR